MCGICGVASFDQTPDRDLLLDMMRQLVHRGPDGCGYYRDERVALGHTRLAIVDAAGGAQPMCNEDGTRWVSFNGEIFNYVELAEELRGRGHTFRTVSDTEVIVHAWEEWGEDCFRRFNGQWALALWDRRARRLVLSRDRVGVRPLFYAHGAAGLVFASEVKSLFADPSLPRALDPAGLDETLTYWSTVAPRTVFAGVEQLPPGHYAVYDESGFRTAPYWTLTFPDRAQPVPDLRETTQELREKLVEAARLRFVRSDVPVGAYLSGGLDSSITTAVVARYTEAPLHTFSLRFSSDEFDEGGYQKVMASALGTQHHDIVVSPRDIAEVFPEVVRHAEAPLLRTAPAPLYLLSKLVRESGYKVVVTGEGADEVFAGYDIFREARVRRFWAADPGSPKRQRAAELLYPWMVRSPGQAPAFARSFFGRNLDAADPALSHRPRWDATTVLKRMLSPDLQAAIGADSADPAGLAAALPAGSEHWDPLGRAQWLETTTLLSGYILAAQGDRMLMANSVEGRFPFLDANVLEFAANLPARYKLFGLDEKYLLKRAFADLVPEEIRRRPKQPYRAPDAASFFVDGTPDWFDDVMSAQAVQDAGVFRPEQVAGLVAKCRRTGGEQMSNTDSMRLMAVISTQLTHRTFIAGNGGATAAPALPALQVAVDLCQGDSAFDTHHGGNA
ncbi:asparagine synthase (glutamine-hydrolyzing) [Catellatospora chokoriensis]|uniref:asparagine synthase (glutamine-hydrolyzing) n=1 Tax=Catellatospora chokoriensis TaxID=310353 RepID=A0A8J3JLS2_9ACTN|nr:asparagine synthase (glutamine-hydrolyzing) [Catellatospora chokoriensis]GIF87212.1 asparagine synthase (glutamine-hydrolyzing) [Catellatospora chokoriensis]